jgi:ABC-type phosphate/phosphonate transport system substrate-binding protein
MQRKQAMVGQPRLRLGLLAAVGMAALLLATFGKGEEQARTNNVRVGVPLSFFRDIPETKVQLLLEPFRLLLEAQTGYHGQVVVSPNAEAVGEQLRDDKVQLGLFHGFEFAWARLKYPKLKPLLLAINHQRQLRAYVMVRQDCSAGSFADLAGKAMTLPLQSREHCVLFLERRCRDCEGKPDAFFSKLRTAGDVEDALDEVVEGTAQATVIDDVSLDWYKRRRPSRFAKLRTLQQSEVFPASVVAYLPGSLPDAALRRFQERMIAANQDRGAQQIMAMCRMTSFEPIPSDYEQGLTDILKAYPPPSEPEK